MIKVELYLNYLTGELLKTLEVEDEDYLVDNIFGRVLKINGKLYSITRRIDLDKDIFEVKELEEFLVENDGFPHTSEDYIECPVCNNIDYDSFELVEEYDEYVCPECGAVLEYEMKQVTVFEVKIKEIKDPIEL